MPKFKFHVDQTFSCTYVVEGDTLEGAWANLIHAAPATECVEQYPEEINSDLRSAGIAVLNEAGDWEDVDLP